jgi:hypothetical protein
MGGPARHQQLSMRATQAVPRSGPRAAIRRCAQRRSGSCSPGPCPPGPRRRRHHQTGPTAVPPLRPNTCLRVRFVCPAAVSNVDRPYLVDKVRGDWCWVGLSTCLPPAPQPTVTALTNAVGPLTPPRPHPPAAARRGADVSRGPEDAAAAGGGERVRAVCRGHGFDRSAGWVVLPGWVGRHGGWACMIGR